MKENMVKEILAHPIASVIVIGGIGSAVVGVIREIMRPSVMKISASQTYLTKPNYITTVARNALAEAATSAFVDVWKGKRPSRIEKDEAESVVEEEKVENVEEECSDGEQIQA